MSGSVTKYKPFRGASHKAYWRDLIARNLEGYREVLQGDPFKEWSKWQRPHRTIEGQLDNGLELLCGDAPRDLAEGYFRKGCLIGQRLITEKGWRRRRWCAFGFPANLGLIRRATAYCQLFLGQPFDPDAACQAANEITQFYAEQDDEGWSEYDQQDFIGGVVLLLVAKQFDEAVRVIRLGWKCPSHAPVWKHVRDIGEALATGSPVLRSTRIAFAKQLESIRKPLRVATIPAFELHLLEQLAESPTAVPNPHLAVARMAR